MTLRYLLDTNIISEPVRPLPNANVMTQLIEAKSTVAIPKVNNLILVTRNVADYANFQDLAIENWFS